MIGLAAAMAVMQAGPGVPPVDPRLEAFRAACTVERGDMAATEALLRAQGWARVGDDDHPELERIMPASRAALTDPEIDMSGVMSVWARTFATGRYHVVVTRIDAVLREEADDDGDGVIQDWERRDVFSQIGCGLWDFDAVMGVPDAAVTAWVGAAPVQSVDHQGMTGGTWNVFHLMPGTAEVHVGFIAEGTPLAGTMFSGVSISMSSAPKEIMAAEAR